MKTSGFDELIERLEAQAEKDPAVKDALDRGRAWAKQVVDDLLKDFAKRHRSFRQKRSTQIANRKLKLFKKNVTFLPHPRYWYSVEKTSYSKCLNRYPRSEKLVRWQQQVIKASRIGVWLFSKR